MRTNFFICGITTLLVLMADGITQPAPAGPPISIGVDLGVFLPAGEWKEHRFARRVDQFRRHIAVGFDLEARLVRRLGLAANGGYINLDVGDWEKYARAQGDAISASARVSYIGVLLKIYLWTNNTNNLKLKFGPNVFFSHGQETFGSLTYEYDFLKDEVGFFTGLEYEFLVSDHVALAVNLNGIFVPAGVEYADATHYTLTGYPLTLGARFHF